MDTLTGTVFQHDTEPRIEFYFPPSNYRFAAGEPVRLSVAGLSPPSAPLWWQSPPGVWLFWQVVLEVNDVEVGRWGADWICDESGQLNLTATLPPPWGESSGRHVAYVVVPVHFNVCGFVRAPSLRAAPSTRVLSCVLAAIRAQ